MIWEYKHHRALMKPVWFVQRVCEFLDILSWNRAHYRNGGGTRGAVPAGLREEVRCAWIQAGSDEP